MVRGRRVEAEAALAGNSEAAAHHIRTAAVEEESVGTRLRTEEAEARRTHCYMEVEVRDFDTVCLRLAHH